MIIQSGTAKTYRKLASRLIFKQFAKCQYRAIVTSDWSATQYLKFARERTRPARELAAQIQLQDPKRIIDLGCGPGNSTQILIDKYPGAVVSGIDSSPNMLEQAKATLPEITFSLGDLKTYEPEESVDILFSNAVFQWIGYNDRISIIQRLIQNLPSGGVFAFQVPDNYLEKSHVCMWSIAENGPWAETLLKLKPGLGPFQSPQELYDAVKPFCSEVDLWHTYYQHALDDHQALVEWVKGTGLRPFIDPLDPSHQHQFLEAYLSTLKKFYPISIDGKVLLRYPRLFMVAKRA